MTTQTVLPPYRVSEEADGAVTDGQPAADAVLREMTELLQDARPSLRASLLTVAAVAVSASVEVAFLPASHTGFGALLSLGLFAVLVLTAAGTLILAIVAGWPLLDELGELRREVGAPVDPTVPWTPMRNWTATFEAPGWDRVRAIVAAAHSHSVRSHLVLKWAISTIICFLTWTLVTLALA